MPPIFRIFSFDNGEPLRGTEIYTKYPKKIRALTKPRVSEDY